MKESAAAGCSRAGEIQFNAFIIRVKRPGNAACRPLLFYRLICAETFAAAYFIFYYLTHFPKLIVIFTRSTAQVFLRFFVYRRHIFFVMMSLARVWLQPRRICGRDLLWITRLGVRQELEPMLTEGVMLVDLFKGTVFCAALGLSTLGGLTVVPDRYWDSFPSALAPAREALAEIGVAPLKFRAGASSVAQPVQKETREPVPAPDQLALEQQTRVQIGAPRRGVGYNPELDRSSLDAESLPTPGGDRNSDSDPIRSTSATSPKFVGTSTEPGADELPNRAPVSIADIPDPPADPLQDQEFFLDEPPLESRESLDSLLASPDSIDSEPLIVEEEKALDPDETKYSTPSRLAAFKTPEKSSVNADANPVAPLAATAATSAAVKAQTANPVAAPVANQSAPLATTSANQSAPLATTSANQSAPLATTSANQPAPTAQ